MEGAGQQARLIFEPHNGFGGIAPDGEPWPFGYISTAPGRPIFQLAPVFEKSAEELRTLAIVMAAAPALVEALRFQEQQILKAISHSRRCKDFDYGPALAQVRAAIALVDGRRG